MALSKEQLQKKNEYYTKGDVISSDVVYHDSLDKEYALTSREEYRDVTFLVNWGAWKKGESYNVALGLSEALIDNKRAKLTYPDRYDTHMTAEQITQASIETEKAFHIQCQMLRAAAKTAAESKSKSMEK